MATLIAPRKNTTAKCQAPLLGYARHGRAVGSSDASDAEAFGLSLQQKVGSLTLEPGLFTVHGNDLRFQETTTGINHALGALMMIYAQQFSADSDTFYLKATTKIDQTALYALYSYTHNDELSLEGQEINVVIKQPITDALSLAFKFGAGYRQYDSSEDTTATDARFVVTYNF